MKNHHLPRIDLRPARPRTIKIPAPQLIPIRIRQPISIPKRLTNISRITLLGSFQLLRAIQNRPIRHRTIRHHSIHPRIERRQNRRRSAKTSSNHKNPIRSHCKSPPKRTLHQPLRQLIDDIQNVLMRRPPQKLAPTLPRSAISRIHHPKSLPRQKFAQPLLARNRGHPIAQNNSARLLARPHRRQKLRHDFLLESSSKHDPSAPTRSGRRSASAP